MLHLTAQILITLIVSINLLLTDSVIVNLYNTETNNNNNSYYFVQVQEINVTTFSKQKHSMSLYYSHITTCVALLTIATPYRNGDSPGLITTFPISVCKTCARFA